MTNQSDGALGTRSVVQISVVVPDAERATEAWAAVLGLPVAAVRDPDLAEAKQRELRYFGEPIVAGARTAFFHLDNVDIEIIEPVEGPSTWSDFLDSRGGGGHHIAFEVDDAPTRLAALAEFGYPTVQTGIRRVGARYGYADATEQLGAFLELLGDPAQAPVDAGEDREAWTAAVAAVQQQRAGARAATRALPAEGPLGTRQVAQVAFAVLDVDDATARFASLLGGRPAAVFEREGSDFMWVRLLGRPIEGALRGALIPTEDLVIEVLQPVGGPSTWSEQLASFGPSMHHVAFEVSDAAGTMAVLGRLGYRELQAGESPRGIYAYADTREALGLYIEVLEPTR